MKHEQVTVQGYAYLGQQFTIDKLSKYIKIQLGALFACTAFK